jgi:peptide/nickel transport system permease protein
MIEVLESEYVQMARLKGLPERTVVIRHALPNALVPVTQASALVLAYLIGGIVVVEFLFGYPGLGSALTDAIGNRDLPVIQAIVLIMATAVVAANLVADIVTVYITPRLRTAQASAGRYDAARRPPTSTGGAVAG